jgi:hypothetical protein
MRREDSQENRMRNRPAGYCRGVAALDGLALSCRTPSNT